MSVNHFNAIVRKEFYHVVRDPGMLFLLLIGPAFLMVILVYALTADVKDVPVVVVDLADNTYSQALVDAIDATEEAHVVERLASADAIGPLLDRNEVRVALVIPELYGVVPETPAEMLTFVASMLSGSVPQLRIIVDGTEPMSAERVLEATYKEVEAQIRDYAQNFKNVPGFDSALLERPVQIETERRYNPDLRTIVDFYPGLAAVVLSLPGVALALALAREQELGTMEQLVATPINKLAMLTGKMVPYLVFGMFGVFAILLLGRVVYDVPFRGSLIGYVVLSFFFLFSNMGIGMLIAVLIRSQQLAMVVAFLIFFVPGFFLSGVFFPLSAMPQIMQIEMQMLPVTHYVVISKVLYLQGAPVTELWFNAAALVAMGAAIMALSVALFRKKVA